ncbi:unnamed protein product [Closterium sp. Naga37s-1]|nr:unnamed protein product [Closterium sp. Naga37s-1]
MLFLPLYSNALSPSLLECSFSLSTRMLFLPLYSNALSPSLLECSFSLSTRMLFLPLYSNALSPSLLECSFSLSTRMLFLPLYSNALSPSLLECSFSLSTRMLFLPLYSNALSLPLRAILVPPLTFFYSKEVTFVSTQKSPLCSNALTALSARSLPSLLAHCPLCSLTALSARSLPSLLYPQAAGWGGWVGYTSYDSVRYVESKKLPFSSAPMDDRHLPDVHLSLYNDVVVFDHVTKIVHVVCWVHVDDYPSASDAFSSGLSRLSTLVDCLQPASAPVLPAGSVNLDTRQQGPPAQSTMTREQFEAAVLESKEHILAGDIFQIVLSQRFERRTFADPFEVYRALRIVNPSPYLAYLQARGSILVASSPEILCRISGSTVVNRPLAGTRRRGQTAEEDLALEEDLLADEKEVAEHVMLVDLGRNDVGKVSVAGSVVVEKLMEVERYSHVMHISSTVTGQLLPHLTCWDALRAALPVGTVSGAPKVRAMELIDELEVTRRGPYAGGIGYVSFAGNMDFALALRTMAGAGVVADSVPAAEWQETVNKAAALGRAIDLAESAFVHADRE